MGVANHQWVGPEIIGGLSWIGLTVDRALACHTWSTNGPLGSEVARLASCFGHARPWIGVSSHSLGAADHHGLTRLWVGRTDNRCSWPAVICVAPVGKRLGS